MNFRASAVKGEISRLTSYLSATFLNVFFCVELIAFMTLLVDVKGSTDIIKHPNSRFAHRLVPRCILNDSRTWAVAQFDLVAHVGSFKCVFVALDSE